MIVSPRGQRLLCILAAIGTVTIVTLTIVDHHRLTHLTRTSPNYASHTDVRALQQRLDAFDTALTRLQHAPASVTQATFDAARQTFDARLDKLEQIAGTTASTNAVNALDARVHQLETHPAASAQAASKAVISGHRHAAAPTLRVPPFAILGEEQRGGQTFLTVAPPHWQAPGDVQLLQPGDSEGDWQLDALDGRTATFRVDGQVLRVPVR
ncbi:Methyl-accepting chemotaxis protein [Burkholderia pseudomallei]